MPRAVLLSPSESGTCGPPTSADRGDPVFSAWRIAGSRIPRVSAPLWQTSLSPLDPGVPDATLLQGTLGAPFIWAGVGRCWLPTRSRSRSAVRARVLLRRMAPDRNPLAGLVTSVLGVVSISRGAQPPRASGSCSFLALVAVSDTIADRSGAADCGWVVGLQCLRRCASVDAGHGLVLFAAVALFTGRTLLSLASRRRREPPLACCCRSRRSSTSPITTPARTMVNDRSKRSGSAAPRLATI